MDKVDLGDKLPLGFCVECLARMAKGALYTAQGVGGGAHLAHAYCAHREAGATIVLRPGRPLRWNIVSPIDAIEWQQHVSLKVGLLRRVLPESSDEALPAVSPGARPAPMAKELLN